MPRYYKAYRNIPYRSLYAHARSRGWGYNTSRRFARRYRRYYNRQRAKFV